MKIRYSLVRLLMLGFHFREFVGFCSFNFKCDSGKGEGIEEEPWVQGFEIDLHVILWIFYCWGNVSSADYRGVRNVVQWSPVTHGFAFHSFRYHGQCGLKILNFPNHRHTCSWHPAIDSNIIMAQWSRISQSRWSFFWQIIRRSTVA